MADDSIFQFELGVRARDVVTGVEGVVTGRTQWMTGCNRYVLEYAKDGEVHALEVDENRCELVPGRTKVELPALYETKKGAVKAGGPARRVTKPSVGRA